MDDLKSVLYRIERRLTATGKTANAASREAGKPDAIRNLKRAIAKGDRQGISTSTIRALAPVLGTTPAWLLDGKGPETTDGPLEPTIKVWGMAGAGGSVYRFHEDDSPIDEISADGIRWGSDLAAVQIVGESLGRLFDGWFAIYKEPVGPPTEAILNELCIVGLADNRIMIKRVRRGRGKRFTLESNYEAPIENVEIVWAAKVENVVPRR